VLKIAARKCTFRRALYVARFRERERERERETLSFWLRRRNVRYSRSIDSRNTRACIPRARFFLMNNKTIRISLRLLSSKNAAQNFLLSDKEIDKNIGLMLQILLLSPRIRFEIEIKVSKDFYLLFFSSCPCNAIRSVARDSFF